MKLTYVAALMPALFLLNGCDAEDEACRYYVQQDLDSGNYQGVIDKLESDASCQADYPGNEHYVDLGTAYLGRAGLTLPRVMSAMIDINENADEFSSFVRKVSDISSDTALLDLSHSRDQFVNYLGLECADLVQPTTDTQDGICLFTAFVDILKTSMAIDTMTGGTISEWLNNPDNPQMLRSTCALQYSYEHLTDKDFSTPYTKCLKDTTIEDKGPVTFGEGELARTYNNLLVTKEQEQYFLENTTFGTTVFTSGFCSIDYSVCNEGDEGCYVCPMSKDGEDLQIKDFVFDALNSGFNNLDSLIDNIDKAAIDSIDVPDTDELEEALDDFKQEISCGDNTNCEVKETLTMDDVIDYLNQVQ